MPAEADVASAILQAGDAVPAPVEIDGLIASESTTESTEGADFENIFGEDATMPGAPKESRSDEPASKRPDGGEEEEYENIFGSEDE
jgi:hypothetical protein